MNKTLSITLVLTLLFVAGFVAINMTSGNDKASHSPAVAVTLYKDINCGCCEVYGKYLSRLGYDVDIRESKNMERIKQKFGIPNGGESCHTMKVSDYVVEGHIPEEVIDTLLAEKPDIHGIGMAGMPTGSPGMSGPKTEEFEIYTITRQHIMGDVFMTL